MISKLEETTDIIEAIESNKGFMIKDNDSRQELKIRGFGEGKKHGLLLRDYEALYLIYSSKLNVIKDKEKLSFNDVLHTALLRDENAWTKFLIYRDIRTRGYVAKEGFGFGADFRVYDKGNFGTKAAKYIVFAMNEGNEINIKSLTDSVKQISRMGKVPIIAVVERRGEVIYYHLSKSHFRELF